MFLTESFVKFDVLSLPRVIDPLVLNVLSREVLDVVGKIGKLLLELVVNDEDGEFSLGEVSFLFRSESFVLLSDILLQFSNSVPEGGSRIIDLILSSERGKLTRVQRTKNRKIVDSRQ